MEDYNHHLNQTTNSRGSGGNFLYGPGPILAPGSSSYERASMSTAGGGGGGFHLHQSGGDCYDHPPDHGPIVKTEAGGSTSHNNNNNNNNQGGGPRFNYHHPHFEGHLQKDDNTPVEADAIKAKIIAHPQYSHLLEAYMDCQKVGAPPEVLARLTEVRQEFEARQRGGAAADDSKDPELDQFMEAYYDMLVKYREELNRPLQEAMEFMRRIETQLNMLTNGPARIFNAGKNKPGE